MAVPSTLASLSTTPSSNPPGGTENPFPELDDHLRQIYSFTALLRDQKAGLAGAQFTGPIAVGIAPTADPATFYRATTGNVISLNTPTGVDGVLAMRRGATDVARVFSVFDGMRLDATQVCRVSIAGTDRFLVNATGPERTDDAAAPNGLVRKSQMDSAVAAAGSGKADVAGSASQVFSVAAATLAAHALRLGQFAASTGTNSLTLEIPCLGLPGGATKIVLQVGYLASRPSVISDHSYNAPFSTACVGVWLTEVRNTQHNDNPKLSAAPGLSTFSIHSDAPSLPIYWVAIGY